MSEPVPKAAPRHGTWAFWEQPTLVLAPCFILGLGLGYLQDWGVWQPWVVCAGLWGVAWLLWLRRRRAALAMCLLTVALGVAFMNAAVPDWYRQPSGALACHHVVGTVTGPPQINQNSLYVTLESITADGQALEGRLRLTVYGGEDPQSMAARFPSGSRVSGALALEHPDDAQFPGGYDLRRAAMAQGIRFFSLVDATQLIVEVPAQQSFSLRDWMRGRIADAAGRSLGGQPAQVILALLTGDRDPLGDDLVDSFKQLGIVHILVVSGMHVGLLLALIAWAGHRLRWGTGRVTWVTAGLVALYYIMTGPQPAVTRVVVVGAVAVAATFSGRRFVPLSALAAAAVALLAFRPTDIFNMGFQLTFLSAAGILLLYPMWRQSGGRRLAAALARWPAFPRRVALYGTDLLAVSLCVQLISWAWTVRAFGAWPVMGPLANLLFIPPAFVILVMAFIFAALALLWAPLALPLGWVLRPVAQVWLTIVGAAARWAPVLSPPALGYGGAACFMAGAALLSDKVMRADWRKRALAVGLTLMLAVGLWAAPGLLAAGDGPAFHALGGQDAMALLVSDGGEVPLLAASRPVYRLADYLRANRLSWPRRLLWLGEDGQSLAALLEDPAWDGTQVWVSPTLYEALAEAGLPTAQAVASFSAGQVISLGEDTVCTVEGFSTVSAGSKQRYAARVRSGRATALFIDPLALPTDRDWTRELDLCVAISMSPARQARLHYVGARYFAYGRADDGLDANALCFYGPLPRVYNLNRTGAVVLRPDARGTWRPGRPRGGWL